MGLAHVLAEGPVQAVLIASGGWSWETFCDGFEKCSRTRHGVGNDWIMRNIQTQWLIDIGLKSVS